MSASMSQDSLGWLCADAFMMDTRSFGGYVKLVGYISRIGSAPTDDRDLATILGITVGSLRKRTWPLIEHLFVEHGDGRMTHPRVQHMAPAHKGVSPTLSEKRRAAGRAGGKQRVANQANWQANPQANGQANPSKNAANSTPVASDFASDLPEFASRPAHARPPPSESSSLPDSLVRPVESEKESKGEGESADAGRQANFQANPQANGQANPLANGQASGLTKSPENGQKNGSATAPRYTLLPDDWQPTTEAVEALRAGGFDPDHVARKFRLYCQANGKRAKDHDKAFELFFLKEDRHEPAQRSAPLARSIAGGKTDSTIAKAEPEPPDEPITGTGPDAQWARATRRLKGEIGAGVYRNWMARASVVGIDADGEATISLPSVFIRDYVRDHYLDRLSAFWRAENPEIIRVSAVVAPAERRAADG
jgi:hypothetical protein